MVQERPTGHGLGVHGGSEGGLGTAGEIASREGPADPIATFRLGVLWAETGLRDGRLVRTSPFEAAWPRAPL